MDRTDKASEPREQTKQIELTDRELTSVTGGGKTHHSEIRIIKLIDASSTRLS
jgi:type VI protein secretion system component Hcp